MTSNEAFSKTINALLASKGLGKQGLAKQLGTTREALGRRLSNKMYWSTDELDTVANYLGLFNAIRLAEMVKTFTEAERRLSQSPTDSNRSSPELKEAA